MVTKSDLPEHEREVTSDMLYGLAAHYNISKTCVFEVSARTGAGVRNMLRVLCMTAVEQYQHGSMDVPPRECTFVWHNWQMCTCMHVQGLNHSTCSSVHVHVPTCDM